MQNKRELILLSTANYYYPIELLDGSVICESTSIEIPKKYPIQGAWGQCSFVNQSNGTIPSFIQMLYLKIVYFSIVESKTYFLDITIDGNILNNEITNKIVLLVGIAPYGGVATWWIKDKKSSILSFAHAKIADSFIMQKYPRFNKTSIHDICNKYINEDIILKNHIDKVGLPVCDLFDNYMKQFTYRYQIVFGFWDKDEKKWIQYDNDASSSKLIYIEESLFDGTYDKLHNVELIKHHKAGKPKRLAIKWTIVKSEYSVYLWFENIEIHSIFNKFYGQHPDTKTDFIIHIDPFKKKYELSLYRYGLKEPVIIPESAYQLIVFKSGFENYRSDNYNQPTGAWIC